MLNSSEAVSTLGKTVEVMVGDHVLMGTVEGVRRGENPQVIVGGTQYDLDQIRSVYSNEHF